MQLTHLFHDFHIKTEYTSSLTSRRGGEATARGLWSATGFLFGMCIKYMLMYVHARMRTLTRMYICAYAHKIYTIHILSTP